VAVFPTNGELIMVYVAAPMTEFASARADLEGHYLRTLDLCGDLGKRIRSGRTSPTRSGIRTGPGGR